MKDTFTVQVHHTFYLKDMPVIALCTSAIYNIIVWLFPTGYQGKSILRLTGLEIPMLLVTKSSLNQIRLLSLLKCEY